MIRCVKCLSCEHEGEFGSLEAIRKLSVIPGLRRQRQVDPGAQLSRQPRQSDGRLIHGETQLNNNNNKRVESNDESHHGSLWPPSCVLRLPSKVLQGGLSQTANERKRLSQTQR